MPLSPCLATFINTHNNINSLAKAVKYACATLSTLAAKPQLKELLLDPRASQALPGNSEYRLKITRQCVLLWAIVWVWVRVMLRWCVLKAPLLDNTHHGIACAVKLKLPLNTALDSLWHVLCHCAGLVRLLSPDVDADEPGVSRRAVEALTVLMRDSRDGQQLVRRVIWVLVLVLCCAACRCVACWSPPSPPCLPLFVSLLLLLLCWCAPCRVGLPAARMWWR